MKAENEKDLNKKLKDIKKNKKMTVFEKDIKSKEEIYNYYNNNEISADKILKEKYLLQNKNRRRDFYFIPIFIGYY